MGRPRGQRIDRLEQKRAKAASNNKVWLRTWGIWGRFGGEEWVVDESGRGDDGIGMGSGGRMIIQMG